ncbi:uncharacterized protein LOC114871902 [Osmia bicornis bicornis]|uniref:uncharacterized protein LOC114871902 n=1 Tax=Osmia bicornis bicornis TaxID=1437191 RepID=UPI001EAF7C47|nr:uncharacterized protein LOC114871902 [Osmia bicornis bicornis]
MHGWHMDTLEEPRDNTDIFPPKGNLFKSSYKRIGTEDTRTGISETQAMLSQIELKDLYKPVYPQRTLHKMRALAYGQIEEEKESTLTDLLYDSEEAKHMDYRTTQEIHYRLPYPMKPRSLLPPPPPEPWLLNRRTIGYSLEQLEKRDGVNTFLDDNMELHRKIADLKMRRNKLHEVTSKN